jgi:hypothetical protein
VSYVKDAYLYFLSEKFKNYARKPLSMKFQTLVIPLLIVGLVIGIGLGSIVFPQTTTSTRTLIETKTLTERVIEKITEVRTEATPITLYSTSTLTIRETSTSMMVKTTTLVSFSTLTMTLTKKIYPGETEKVLINDSGSGNKDTRPFTLNETSDLKITLRVYPTADLKYVLLSWYLYIPEVEKWIRQGSISQESGILEFYATHIPPGNYYVRVISANCRWELTVEKVG